MGKEENARDGSFEGGNLINEKDAHAEDEILREGSAGQTCAADGTGGSDTDKSIKAGNSENNTGRSGRKKRRSRKERHAGRTMLRILQHMCLGVMVLALVIVVSGSTISVDGFRKRLGFNLYSMDQSGKYEDSDLFNNIFGYAAADIIRYGVVSSQLETDGIFDGGKVVDVTAYNYRDIGLPERYVTAEYTLEDLLKWANYGFEWSVAEMTLTQAEKFLAEKTRVRIIDPKSEYYNTSDASYLKSDIQSYTFVNDVSANQIWVDSEDYDGFVEEYDRDNSPLVVSEAPEEDSDSAYMEVEEISESGEGVSNYNVLVNRYKSAEGKNLEEYVSDWDIYYDLCHNVQNAAKSLSYNYSEYLDYEKYYSPADSNVRYLIMKTVGKNTEVYTNFDDENDLEAVSRFMVDHDGENNPRLKSPFKYIYYSPSDMIYQTNTTIEEETIRQILQGYDYAYPETVKIWIDVDTTYPVEDAFRQGATGYRNYVPYFWQWVTVMAVSGILYLILLCYLTVVAGRGIDEEGRRGIRLEPFDRVPTEAAVLLGAGAAVLAVWVLIIAVELTNFRRMSAAQISETIMNSPLIMGILLAAMFVADAATMFFFYSLVRRIKAGTLWKNSYLCRAIQRMKKFAWNVYDNGHIVLRVWIPYCVFLLFNLIMLLLAFSFSRFGTLLMLAIAVAADMVVGKLLYRNAKEQQDIVKGIETIAAGELEHQVRIDNLHGDNLTLAHSVNSIGKGIKEAVEISMKDERMKADLITNVSHDIKTPLTSIINYVDLIKREQVDNVKIRNYIKVLDEKSQRLKQLTDDLVEASKISSGNISLHFEKINLTELMNQTIGEFSEKFEVKNLTTVMNVNVPNAVIETDSRRIWRVIENLFNNIFKYAMEGTRVYVTIESFPDHAGYIAVSIKNISASPLNCNPDELTERFIRGDESRTTEGSGLGLSIAKNLTEVQKGTFEIQLDGDLFKVILTFPLAET